MRFVLFFFDRHEPPRQFAAQGAMTAVVSVVFATALHAEHDRLTLISGETIDSAVISEIRPNGVILGDQVPAGLNLDGLRRIDRREPDVAAADRGREGITVELAGGGSVQASEVVLRDEQFTVRGTSSGSNWTLSIDAVRGLRFGPSAMNETFQQTLEKPAVDFDQIFVRLGGTIQPVPGLVESITEAGLVFQWQNRQRQIPLDRVHGVVLASLPGTDQVKPRCTIRMDNGDLLVATRVELRDEQLKASLTRDDSVAVQWSQVAQLRIRSDRLTFLSDLDPVEHTQRSIVTLNRPWRRDQSVLGRPLTLWNATEDRAQTFEKGLGTHANCRLVFDLDKRYDAFVATIGIDTETQGHGDCNFVVLTDGIERMRKQLRGDSSSQQITVDVRGTRYLSLIVEAGEDLDLADHANWCDAHVIRRPGRKP